MLIEPIYNEYDYCKKMIKKHLNNNLFMSAEEEERFQLSNNCWICDKLFDFRDENVRDHCHITGKCRGSAHWSCNINLKLTKNSCNIADVFEKFINKCLDYYGLDPCHYVSSPGLSWDAMLKMTKIKLDLISDIDMHLFVEKGMRGGFSYTAKRYSKANNKYMEYYDSGKESKYITYLDANKLYGWAMSQYLPYSGSKWLNQKEISNLFEFC